MTRPGKSGGLAARAAAWREADPDPQTRAELGRLLAGGDTAALAERFEGSLAFGTAGIRAEMGAGSMRMNRLVAGRVAAGLARYIAAGDPAAAGSGNGAGVVVGYDGRAKSAVFAADAARILSRAGVSVSMLPRALPTPVLAFAVRHTRAAYGLMVTASHNPRQDNGIKVYVGDGGQLLPPADAEIAAFIDAVDPLALPAGWAEGPFEFTPADDAVQRGMHDLKARRPGRRALRSCIPRCTASGMARCERCLPRPAGRRRPASPPSGSPTLPSRPCLTPTRNCLACLTWPGRPPSGKAPTWSWPMTRTPTGWPSWSLALAAGSR
jgi:hypothetical protein